MKSDFECLYSPDGKVYVSKDSLFEYLKEAESKMDELIPPGGEIRDLLVKSMKGCIEALMGDMEDSFKNIK